MWLFFLAYLWFHPVIIAQSLRSLHILIFQFSPSKDGVGLPFGKKRYPNLSLALRFGQQKINLLRVFRSWGRVPAWETRALYNSPQISFSSLFCQSIPALNIETFHLDDNKWTLWRCECSSRSGSWAALALTRFYGLVSSVEISAALSWERS